MNKSGILPIILLVFTLIFALTACSESHTHEYASKVTAPTCTAPGFTTYTCSCGDSYTADEVAALGHNHEATVTEPTCTVDGYTTHTCSGCGDSYTDSTVTAPGHSYTPVVTKPTCTVDGYTTYTCSCGDSYTADPVTAPGHNYVFMAVTEPTCTEDGYTTRTCGICSYSYTSDHVPAAHKYDAVVTKPTCTTDGYTTHTCSGCKDSYTDSTVTAPGHSYTPVVTEPTCSAAGYTTHTCSACGDSYTDSETETVPHVDANLDITCDYDGCTKRILPEADSEISLFTANNMIIISLSSNYYVQGVVTEVVDAYNGIFIIEDEAGDSLLVRLPKNANGDSYTTWENKVVLGDTVRIYGKPTRNTGNPTTEQAKMESGVLTVVSHTHSFSEPDCKNPATCGCLATSTPALGHEDGNGDNLCDRCGWNVKLSTTSIAVSTDTTVTNGVLDDAKTKWTWTDGEFDVVIAKGSSTSTLYTTVKTHMQFKKQNTLTVSSHSGLKIYAVTISASNASQLANLQAAVGTQYEFTVDEASLSITIVWDSAEDFVLSNQGSTTVYVNNVEIAYEAPSEA